MFCDALGAITLARSSAYYFKNGEEYVIPSKDIFFRALVADGASSTFDASNFEFNFSTRLSGLLVKSPKKKSIWNN